MNRELNNVLRRIQGEIPSVRVVNGVITSVNTSSREVLMNLGNASVRVWVPSSITLPVVNDRLFCIEEGGHYWPFAYHH